MSIFAFDESLFPQSFTGTGGLSITSIIPPDLFVGAAAIVGAMTISKSYYDTVISMSVVAPRLVILAYSVAALFLSGVLGYMTYFLGTIKVAVQGGTGTEYLFLSNGNIQLMRWSFVLGSVFMSLGPFLLMPPIRKILVERKKHRILHAIVQFAQSKVVRYFTLMLFVIVTLFQVFVAYSLVVVLLFGPWFRASFVQGISVGFCYMFVAMFYLYAFYYSMVQKEKKEEALDVGDMASASILKRLRSSVTYSIKSEVCHHHSLKECDDCIKQNMLDTKAYLIFYMVSFSIVNLAALGEQGYFWYFDLNEFVKLGRVGSFNGIVTIVFGSVTFISHVAGLIFLFNEAFRIVVKTIEPSAAAPQVVPDAQSIKASAPLDGIRAEASIRPDIELASPKLALVEERPESNELAFAKMNDGSEDALDLIEAEEVEDEMFDKFSKPKFKGQSLKLRASSAPRKKKAASPLSTNMTIRMDDEPSAYAASSSIQQRPDIFDEALVQDFRADISVPASASSVQELFTDAPSIPDMMAAQEVEFSKASVLVPQKELKPQLTAPSSAARPQPARPKPQLSAPSVSAGPPQIPGFGAPTMPARPPTPAHKPHMSPPPMDPSPPPPPGASAILAGPSSSSTMRPSSPKPAVPPPPPKSLKRNDATLNRPFAPSTLDSESLKRPTPLVPLPRPSIALSPDEMLQNLDDLFQGIQSKRGTIIAPERRRGKALRKTTGDKVIRIIGWLTSADHIHVPGDLFQSRQEELSLLLEDLVPTFQQHSTALFSHLASWLISRLSRELTPQEQLILHSVPEHFDIMASTMYAESFAPSLFRSLFEELYPNVSEELGDFDDSLATIDDVITLMGYLNEIVEREQQQ